MEKGQRNAAAISPDAEFTPTTFRWVVLAVAWFALLMSVIDRIAWANVSAEAGKDIGLDAISALSAFSTASHLGFLLAAIFGGLLTDWLGPRKMMTATMLGLGVLTACFGKVDTALAGLIFQFGMGSLAGPAYAIGVKLISSWYPRIGRATAMGVFMTATSLAVVLVNAWMPLWSEYASWRSAFFGLGAITALAGVIALTIVRDGPDTGVKSVAVAASPFATVMPLLRNRHFRWLALANFGGPWGTWGFAIWASTMLVSAKDLTTIEAGAIVASFGIGAVFAKLMTGIISDLMGGRRKLLAMIILGTFAAGLLVFGQLDTIGQFTLFAPVLGFFAFGYSPLLNTMIAETAHEKAGSAAGLSLVMTTAGDSVQPLLLGFVYHSTGSFALIFTMLAAGPLLAVFSISRVKEVIPHAEYSPQP